MNKLAISNLRLILHSGIVSKKLNRLENLKNYSKDAVKKPIDEPDAKKDSKPVYITLFGTDGIPTTSTLESALKLSKRRNLRLIKVSDYDKVKQTPVYKFLTGTEVLKEDLESKKKKKDTGYKSDKILSISVKISSHDLESKCKQVFKWLEKKHGVRVTIVGSITDTKGEVVFKEMEDKIKSHGRILQKRSTGNDIKFQVIPLKETNTTN